MHTRRSGALTDMMHIIGQILFGLVVGVVAKLIFPGHDPGGIIVTALLGMGGAWLGGYLGRALGWYEQGNPAGFLMAVVGALIILLGYHLLVRGNSTGRTAFFETSPIQFISRG
jgi:uncharacterized membrane protein YeaQ/YmgE (transglycosylase-associated protein family)